MGALAAKSTNGKRSYVMDGKWNVLCILVRTFYGEFCDELYFNSFQVLQMFDAMIGCIYTCLHMCIPNMIIDHTVTANKIGITYLF